MVTKGWIGTIAKFNQLKAIYRLILCLLTGTTFYFLPPASRVNLPTRIFLAWDVFSMCMIILSWLTFATTGPRQMRELARVQDESRSITYLILLTSNCTSLLAVVLLLISKDAGEMSKEAALLVTIAGMAFSWLLMHTVFTLRYAHLYYGDSLTTPAVHAGGLNFPGEEKPDYIDFAYFSFVLGMTFQVSDVEITSKSIRRLALIHGILSFVFNTTIIAITINLLAGLRPS